MTRGGLRFGLLGEPVLYEGGDGRELPGGVREIRSPKLRLLLAVLLLDAGRVVSLEVLKEAMWGASPPVSAQPSLHNHVARLRRLLDDPARLVTVPTGYVLRVGDGELDVQLFDAHTTAAGAAHTARDWERVQRECTSALALWRGTPLGALAPEAGGYALVRRLSEARLLLLEWRYDAELALGGGRLADLVPELAALAAEHPMREAYHRQLMLALHRTGRQAEALVVHRDLRARLADELGIEPGPGVREAHVEVLRGRRGGDRGHEGGDPGHGHDQGEGQDRGDGNGTTPPRPAQLPPPPVHFTGREVARDRLIRALTRPQRSDVPAVTLIGGTAGVGKSALALQVAHALKERFSDGQLYVNLHGATPGMTPLTPAQALTALLRNLGTDPCAIPEHPDAAAALLRSLLAPTRTLLVLDGAANAAQVRPLLPAGAGCAVIVTSRSPLTALDGAARVLLAPLSDEDSAALLRAVSGREGLDAGHPLVALTGRLPLALRVVAARLAARRALTPEALARELSAGDSRLPHLEYDDLSVRRSLAVAHDALRGSEREADRDAARALCCFGVLDLPGYSAPLIARLTGTDERRAGAALDRLVDVALMEETAYGRYVPYDLVRDFARERAAADTAAVSREDAADTALRWYAAVAERALAAIVEPGLDLDDRRRPTLSQPPGHTAHLDTVPPFADAAAAFAWGDRELENIVTLVERNAGCTTDAGGAPDGHDVDALDRTDEQAVVAELRELLAGSRAAG